MLDDIENAYPLTPLQEGMLYEVLKAPDTDVYVAYVVLDVNGPLNIPAFKQAWLETCTIYESLRTRFVWEGLDEPLQLVDKQATLTWRTVAQENHQQTASEWLAQHTDAPSDQEKAVVAYWLNLERNTQLHLGESPPHRFTLLQFSPVHSVLIWTVHHLLADDWSTPKVLKSVLDAYCPESVEKMAPSDAAVSVQQTINPLPYERYVTWLLSTDMTAHEHWWQQKLFDARPTPLLLASSAQVSAELDQTMHPRLVRRLDSDTARTIGSIATSSGVTQSTVFHSVWALTLAYYVGTDSVMFGTSVAGRTCPLAGIEQAVGLFLNTLPTRIEIERSFSIEEFLGSVQQTLFEQLAHEHVPLSKLQTMCPAAHARSLFDSVLVVESHGTELNLRSTHADGIGFDSIRYETDSNYPLTILVFPGVNPEVHLLARKSLISTDNLYSLADKFQGITHLLCTRQHESIASLMDASQFHVPDRTKSTAVLRRPAWSTIHAWFADTAMTRGQAIALRHDDQHLSYEELLQQAVALAKKIQKLAPESPSVGIYLDRGIEQIVALLGILFSGRGYLVLDKQWPVQRLRAMLALSDTQMIVCSTDAADRFEGLSLSCLAVSGELIRGTARVTTCRTIGAPEGTHQLLTGDSQKPPHADCQWVAQTLAELEQETTVADQSASLAYLMFTSGSTGTPKAVPVNHQHLVYSTAARLAFYERTPQAFLLLSSLAFDSSVAGVFWTLCSGGTLVLQSGANNNDVEQLASLISEHRVSHTLCLPSVYELLLRYAATTDLNSLDTVIVAGEACPAKLPRLHERLLPETHLFNEYGPTEATVWSTVAQLYPGNVDSEYVDDAIPLGQAIPGSCVLVQHANGLACPPGVVGEIVVAGPGVVPGYANDANEKVNRFVEGFGDDAQWGEFNAYKTGDLGYFDTHATLFYQGRSDEQIKIRGMRIEPGEVVARVVRHSAVLEAYCTAVIPQHNASSSVESHGIQQDAIRMQDRAEADPPSRQQLVCYVVLDGWKASQPCAVLHDDAAMKLMHSVAAECEQWIEDELPPVFKVWRFIPVSSMPLLPNGKLDKHAFPPVPLYDSATGAGTVAATKQPSGDLPRQSEADALIAQLCQLLQQQLGVSGLSGESNFFSAGGDSLSAIRFVALCREQGLALTIPMISQHPTMAALATALHAQKSDGAERRQSDQRITAVGKLPLTPVQRWFFSQCPTVPEHWNMAFTLDLGRHVETQALQNILAELMASIPVLRTSFTHTGSGWEACIKALPESGVEEIMLFDCIPEAQIDQVVSKGSLQEHTSTGDAVSGIAVDDPVDCVLIESLVRLQKHFDLSKGRLVGVSIAEDSLTKHSRRVGVVIHHLLTDAISNQLLADRIIKAIESTRSGMSVSLQEVSYREWSWLVDETTSSADSVMTTASDQANSKVLNSHWVERDVISVTTTLDSELLEALAKACQRFGVHLHELILYALLSSIREQHEVQIHLETHGRDLLSEHIDTSSSIGWFTSFVSLDQGLLNAMTLAAFCSELREQRLRRRSEFMADPESYLSHPVHPGNQTQSTREPIPLLYNFLASSFDARQAVLHGTNAYQPVLDDRLRDPQSPRSHPVECIVLDAAGSAVDILWRLDRTIVQKLNVKLWQERLLVHLHRCVADERTSLISETRDFTHSGLDDDELDRLLDSL